MPAWNISLRACFQPVKESASAKVWNSLFFLLATLFVACSQGADTGGTSWVADTATPREDSAPPQITYPRGDRILIYTGHGGQEGQDNGWGEVNGIDEYWKELYGWNTDWRGYLEEDLSSYRLIGFMSPGSTGESPFSDDELGLLRGAMEDGTRMLIMTEVGFCATETVNQLLEGLEVDMRFGGEGAQEYQVVEATAIADHQLTVGVETLAMSDPCYVETNGSDAIISFESHVLLAVDRPGTGGDVVAIGDFEFLDDSGSHFGDYLALLERLVEVDPDFTQGQ